MKVKALDLQNLLGKLDVAGLKLADASRALAVSVGSASIDAARMNVTGARNDLIALKEFVEQMRTPACEFCDDEPNGIRALVAPGKSLELADRPCPACRHEEGFA